MTLVALVLAAGSATRFGADKLAARFGGRPLLEHAIAAARQAPVGRVIVVCGESREIGAWPASPLVETVRIASTAISDSLKAGIAAAGQAEGAFVFLGDMPLVPPDVAGRLAPLLPGAFAVIPRFGGRNGHPVLLSAAAFPCLRGLEGDQGAGKLLGQRDDVAFLDVADEGVLLDVDRAGDVARLESRHAPPG